MTDEQKTLYHQLAVAISGDPYYGRAAKECPTCEGSGKKPDWENPRQIGEKTPWMNCTDCGGHGSVFREWLPRAICGDDQSSCKDYACAEAGRQPDEAGREVIAEAVLAWWRSDNDIELKRECHQKRNAAYKESGKWSNADYADSVWPWSARHGQPWEQSLTDFVRNYRREPTDFSTLEGCEELKGMLRDAGWDYSVTYHHIGQYHSAEIFGVAGAIGTSDNETDALVAAAVAAFLEITTKGE